MPKFGEIVERLRLEMNLSLRQLSKLTGISPSAIHSYECGKREPSYKSLEALSDVFNCDIDYLLGKTDVKNKVANSLGFSSLKAAYDAGIIISPISSKPLPMLGNVACGEPIFADETRDAFVSVDNDLDADFCLTAQGDSMINARIFDGDVLFVKKQEIVNDGEIAVVLIGDEATVKRVYYDRENNMITLVPENPLYKPMRYMGEDLDRIRIIGKVIVGQYVVDSERR